MWRWTLIGVLLAASLVPLAGCGTTPPAADAASLAASLTAALSSGDEAAFSSSFAEAPASRFLASRLWTNLTQFTVTITGEDAELRVSTSAPGDREPAVDVLTAQWAAGRDDRPLLASLGAAPGSRVPLWLSDDLRVVRAVGCTLIVPRASARDLASTCVAASRRVQDAGLARLSPTWTRTLVVEVPASAADFASLTITDEAGNRGVGALTQREGDEVTTGAARVVVNPDSAWSGPLDQVEALLAHEGVHHALADRTPALPLWTTEGLADHVGLPASPGWLAGVEPRLAATFADDPATLTMPTDGDFAGDAVTDHAALQSAYDRAWLMVDTLVEHRGRERALDDLARLAAGGRPVPESRWLGWARARISVVER